MTRSLKPLKKEKNNCSSLFAFFIAAILFSCAPTEKKQQLFPEQGKWLFKMDLKKAILPFEAEFNISGTDKNFTIYNAEEEIIVEEIIVRNDSLIIPLPVFESEFFLEIVSPTELKGVWVNYYKGDDYLIDVSATKTKQERFENKVSSSSQLYPKYEVTFSPNEEEEYKAIGLFEQNDNRVSGTFATETGDYRFLEGAVINDSLFLSTFDGSHAFYFAAAIKDSTLSGIFLSGTHFKEGWIANVNSDFSLRNPDSLTSTIDSSAVSFNLENAQGEMISLNDYQFSSKVKIIQIMGSWCPNCLDESLYLNELKKKYNDQGLEIIGVAFERTRNKERALKNIQRLKDQKDIGYPILLGGYDRDQHPMDIFPMLDKIMSYPTTLFLDRKNNIRKIYTGFYGPGTGKLYEQYKVETESFIDELLEES